MKIDIKNLSCGYAGNAILKNINFSISSGEAVCILGANGIGKTTLFKTLLGIIKPISGGVYIDGKDIITEEQIHLPEIFSYVPQAKENLGDFTVKDVVLMGRVRFVGKFSGPKEKDYYVVERILKELGVEEFLDRKYSKLSGGEQQMILVARAIAQESKYLLLDEPASNLDFKNQERLLQTILQLKKIGMGIIMVTHLPDHAFACCQKSYLISQNGEGYFGNSKEIITTENLRHIYGANLKVLNNLNGEDNFKTCYLQVEEYDGRKERL